MLDVDLYPPHAFVYAPGSLDWFFAPMTLLSESARPGLRPSLFVLICMAALGPIALNIYVPSMPGLQKALHTDFATVQLTLTLFLAAMAGMQLVVGPLSDRFGRRPVFLAGTVVFVAASFLAAFAGSVEELIAARILQAAGGCAGVVLARAIVGDIYGRDEAASAIGYVTMAMVVAPMIAPAIGGYLDNLAGWRSGFLVVAGLGAFVLLISLRGLHETHFNVTERFGMGGVFRDGARLVRDVRFVGYALNSAFGSGLYFAFLAGAPFIVTSIMELTPADYGLYFILVTAGYMLGNYMSGRWSTRIGINRMLVGGTLVQMAGVALLLVMGFSGSLHPASIFFPMAVVAISNGITIPNATAAAISVRPDIAGSGSGLLGFAQIGIGALTTIVVGVLHDGTRGPMIWVMCGCFVIATAFFLLALSRTGERAAAGN